MCGVVVHVHICTALARDSEALKRVCHLLVMASLSCAMRCLVAYGTKIAARIAAKAFHRDRKNPFFMCLQRGHSYLWKGKLESCWWKYIYLDIHLNKYEPSPFFEPGPGLDSRYSDIKRQYLSSKISQRIGQRGIEGPWKHHKGYGLWDWSQ
jgi:hypothetical protein